MVLSDPDFFNLELPYYFVPQQSISLIDVKKFTLHRFIYKFNNQII